MTVPTPLLSAGLSLGGWLRLLLQRAMWFCGKQNSQPRPRRVFLIMKLKRSPVEQLVHDIRNKIHQKSIQKAMASIEKKDTAKLIRELEVLNQELAEAEKLVDGNYEEDDDGWNLYE
jgi:hypothetical protein